MKILVTSIGSLLGQNILDGLESRRDRIKLIGVNSGAQSSRIFRSDVLYMVPPTAEKKDFFDRIIEIIETEKPDLILAGRDDDAIRLSELKETNNRYSHMIPCGCSEAAILMQDKLASYEFSKRNNLPFAETYWEKDNAEKLELFCRQNGFPLVVKQKDGFGSHGVYFVNDIGECKDFLGMGNFIIQEYLDPDKDIDKYFKRYRTAIPLFFHIPEDKQYAAQVIIGPTGKMSRVFTSVNRMVLGRCEYSEEIEDKELEKLALNCAGAFAKMGWCGPLNIQCKPDKKKQWKIHEYNPRMSGSTSARLRMGFDEIGMICSMFRPDLKFPDLSTEKKLHGYVERSLTDTYVSYSYIEELRNNKVWKRSS